jgi:hypothetical protein
MAQPPPAWGEQTPQPRPNGADQPTQPQPQQNWGLPSTQEGWGHVPQGPPTHNPGGSPPPPPRRPRRWYERPEILIPLALVVFLALGFGVYAATNIVGQKATPTSTTQQRHVITGTFLLSGTEGRISSLTMAAARERAAMTMSSGASRSPSATSPGP